MRGAWRTDLGTLTQANATIYTIYATKSSQDFHDVTSGSNTSRYSATKGYDAVTGLGSPIVSSLVADLGKATATTGTKATVTIAIGNSQGFGGFAGQRPFGRIDLSTLVEGLQSGEADSVLSDGSIGTSSLLADDSRPTTDVGGTLVTSPEMANLFPGPWGQRSARFGAGAAIRRGDGGTAILGRGSHLGHFWLVVARLATGVGRPGGSGESRNGLDIHGIFFRRNRRGGGDCGPAAAACRPRRSRVMFRGRCTTRRARTSERRMRILLQSSNCTLRQRRHWYSPGNSAQIRQTLRRTVGRFAASGGNRGLDNANCFLTACGSVYYHNRFDATKLLLLSTIHSCPPTLPT